MKEERLENYCTITSIANNFTTGHFFRDGQSLAHEINSIDCLRRSLSESPYLYFGISYIVVDSYVNSAVTTPSPTKKKKKKLKDSLGSLHSISLTSKRGSRGLRVKTEKHFVIMLIFI